MNDLDTDVDSRNEKMWNYCLDSKNNSRIRITVLDNIALNGETQTHSATLFIRGKEKPISLKIKAEQISTGDLIIDLNGDLSLKALEIPDPSIVVASVKDEIKLESHLLVKPK